MPPMANDGAPGQLRSRLDRHQERRGEGIPRVSVVLDGGDALASLRAWGLASGRGRALIVPLGGDWTEETVVRGWLLRLGAATDPGRAASEWLARKLGRAPDETFRSFRDRSHFERELFLESALPMAGHAPADAVCAWILGHLADDGRFEPTSEDDRIAGIVSILARIGSRNPWVELLTALATIYGEGRLPPIVFAAESEDGGGDLRPPRPTPDRLDAAARLLSELVAAHPPLPAAVVVDPAAWQDYMDRGEESRAKSVLRQSVIPAEWSRPVPRTAEERARQAVVESLADPADAEKASRARSAAEQFLFERLEARPETAGLFQLNATLGFTFNSSRPVEIDLLAPSLDLAIEIDGYHHFTSPDAYRRDRRKDILLQTHGHMVVRVLAEDVVSHLEETLGVIRAAVAHRRGQRAAGIEKKDDS